jgi:GT2 family glycosyltransferase
MARVAAVLVSWNSRLDVLGCLAALRRSTLRPATTIVVDNASADGTPEAVRAAHPEVVLLAQSRNLHFARGANLGIESALGQGADYVWVLNPDTRPDTLALAELVRVAESDPALGIVGARLVHPPRAGRATRVVVGARCDFATGAVVEPPPPADPALDRLAVDYVWGCALLARAEVLRQLGGFDAGYVAYYEDADLCLRARAHGWGTLTALRAVVAHTGSAAGDRRFAQQMWLRGRNWLRCYWRHAPPALRPRLLAWMLLYRLPELAWATGVTYAVRSVRRLVNGWRG